MHVNTLYKSFSYTPIYTEKKIYSLNNSICYLKGYKYQHIMRTHCESHTAAFHLLNSLLSISKKKKHTQQDLKTDCSSVYINVRRVMNSCKLCSLYIYINILNLSRIVIIIIAQCNIPS